MKLYKTTAVFDVSEDGTEVRTEVSWAGSQAEASKARSLAYTKGAKRKEVETEMVEVPTHKEGLLDFLNTWNVV